MLLAAVRRFPWTLVLPGLLAITACSDAPIGPIPESSETGASSTSAGSMTTSSSSSADSTGGTSGGSTGSSSGSTGSSSDSTGRGSSDSGSTSSSTSASDSVTDSTSDPSSSGSSSSGSGTGSTSGTSSSDSGTGSTSDSGSSDSGDTGGGDGTCMQVCADVLDCVPAGGAVADWACVGGYCEYVAPPPPCDRTVCPAAAGFMCALVDGLDLCTVPCTIGGGECDTFLAECTGVTDMGDMICVLPPCSGAAEGDPCTVAGLGDYGTCTGGICTCSDDSECTIAGYACQS